jgi:seryl-tRNA synthetase
LRWLCNAAVQVSGSKFYYLKGAATLLELALVNWAITRVAAKGFNGKCFNLLQPVL